MKIPFVKRSEYDKLKEELYNNRCRIVAYVPAEYPSINGVPCQIPADDYCHHDSRIGWVRAKEFDTYSDYIIFLKEERSKDHPKKIVVKFL